MLRVIKPSSPMNFGTWVVTAFTALAFAAAARELLRTKLGDPPPPGLARLLDWALATSGDLFGVPLAILLAGYTGVLLSTTSTPVWCKNRWIGALFSASAIGAGTSAIHLSTGIKQLWAPAGGTQGPGAGSHTLDLIETVSHAAEVVALAGYLAEAGELAKPLTRGKQKSLFWLGAVGAGLVLPTLLRHGPAPAKWRRWLGIGASVLALAGGAALRWAFVEAGKESGSDPDAARKSSKPRRPEDSLAKRPPSA
jgi:formate-dependent nitrite reductase membrane component NrfD